MSQPEDKHDFGELDEIPRDSYELIDALNAAYPHRCILPGETLESAHRYAGLRQLIDGLLELKREEQQLAAEESAQDDTDGMGVSVLKDGIKRR